jgi:hypothetical protein
MTRPFVRILGHHAAALLIAGLFVVSSAEAQVPRTLNYQGRLLQNTSDQDAVSGTVDIVFSIWSGPASDGGAVEFWSESWSGITLSNGIFSVLLGSNGSPLDPSDFQGDTSLFLQLEIDGETLLPRQQLGSTPFAMVDEPDNEFQDLSLSNDMLGLSDSAAEVDLSPYLDNTDEQDLELSGDTLSLTGDATPVDLSPYLDDVDNQVLSRSGDTLELTSDDGTDSVDLSDYLDNTDEQDLGLSGNTLSLTGDATPVDLSGYLDNTDDQTLSLSGSTLSIADGNSVSLTSFLDDTDDQTLGLSGSTLSISGGNSVNLGVFLDNTDSQDIASVLANGTNAGDRDLTNLDDLNADKVVVDSTFECDGCVESASIKKDTILGNDITDNIYILHIDCNGGCSAMSMKDACNVIENLRGIDYEVELVGVSCVHGIPSTTGNGFVACDDGDEVFGDYECRAFNLRTLGDIPCIGGDGTDAIVTCYQTDIAK